jgi:hypothetical protein
VASMADFDIRAASIAALPARRQGRILDNTNDRMILINVSPELSIQYWN